MFKLLLSFVYYWCLKKVNILLYFKIWYFWLIMFYVYSIVYYRKNNDYVINIIYMFDNF